MVSQEPLHQFLLSDSITSETQFGDQHFNAYGSDSRGNEAFPLLHDIYPGIRSLGERIPMSMGSDISNGRHLMDLMRASNESNRQTRGLSLSLGSGMLLLPSQHGQSTLHPDLHGPNCLISGVGAREGCNPSAAFSWLSPSPMRAASASFGAESSTNDIGTSVYLRPAQSLLEETVNVGGEAIDLSNDEYISRLSPSNRRRTMRHTSELKAELCSDGLSSAEKHQLQNKLGKLIGLLEEIDSRYEDYYRQMEQVVSSFEAVAGSGAAKTYTALALQAMSRHFCHLRDAIMCQIRSARKQVSKGFPKINRGLSRLSLLDQESRQNHSPLRPSGMAQNQHQTWRPIRGLPDSSVAILRAWLFDHFLHPYPNDSEKLMLASQTGLTKNQVSNWFINARVRLWKPMIEEMYKEEFVEASEGIEDDVMFASSSVSRESVTDHSDE